MAQRQIRFGVILLLIATPALTECTVDDVRNSIIVVERVPAPSGAGDAHRLNRSLGLGGNTSRVERGGFTSVTLRVLSPQDADLFPYLRIELWVRTQEGRSQLAVGADFEQGETERALDVIFTGDITPFLADEDLQVEWDIFYRSGVSYPASGIDLETTIGVSVDVRIL